MISLDPDNAPTPQACPPSSCESVLEVDLRTGQRRPIWAGDTSTTTAVDLSVSSDGRLVAFNSNDPGILPGKTSTGYDTYVWDRASAAFERESVNPQGADARDDAADCGSLVGAHLTNCGSAGASISASGRFVAFGSNADDLVPGQAPGPMRVYVRDRENHRTELVSTPMGGGQLITDALVWDQAISADGRFIVFSSGDSALPGHSPGCSQAPGVFFSPPTCTSDIYVHDRSNQDTRLVSRSMTGSGGNSGSFNGVISADANHVAFVSDATDLVPNQTSGNTQYFEWDRAPGRIVMVSVSSSGAQSVGYSAHVGVSAAVGGTGTSSNALPFESISSDGRYVAFNSTAANLVSNKTTAYNDVFVHDLLTGATTRESVSSSGAQADNDCFTPVISSDGTLVIFTSRSFAGNSRGPFQVYLHELEHP
jgi:hypothetical protein